MRIDLSGAYRPGAEVLRMDKRTATRRLSRRSPIQHFGVDKICWITPADNLKSISQPRCDLVRQQPLFVEYPFQEQQGSG